VVFVCFRFEANEEIDRALSGPTRVQDVRGKRPTEAVALLNEAWRGDGNRQVKWFEDARIASILGSCPRSIASWKSGVRNWLVLVEAAKGKAALRTGFPPTLNDILAWQIFLCVSVSCLVQCC